MSVFPENAIRDARPRAAPNATFLARTRTVLGAPQKRPLGSQGRGPGASNDAGEDVRQPRVAGGEPSDRGQRGRAPTALTAPRRRGTIPRT